MSTSTSKTPRFYLALAAGKATAAALKLARRNGGQLPGSVAEAICPDFLARCPKPRRVVFVTGTNGKTTTSNLLDDILLACGFDLVTNRAGGNIITGIESSLIKNARMSGSPRCQVACMELDELSSRRVLPHMVPEVMLVANLYRDNFTRNANPDYIFSVIDANIPASTHLVLNADDLISCRLAPRRQPIAHTFPSTILRTMTEVRRVLSAILPRARSAAARLSMTGATCAIWVARAARRAVSRIPSPTIW